MQFTLGWAQDGRWLGARPLLCCVFMMLSWSSKVRKTNAPLLYDEDTLLFISFHGQKCSAFLNIQITNRSKFDTLDIEVSFRILKQVSWFEFGVSGSGGTIPDLEWLPQPACSESGQCWAVKGGQPGPCCCLTHWSKGRSRAGLREQVGHTHRHSWGWVGRRSGVGHRVRRCIHRNDWGLQPRRRSEKPVLPSGNMQENERGGLFPAVLFQKWERNDGGDRAFVISVVETLSSMMRSTNTENSTNPARGFCLSLRNMSVLSVHVNRPLICPAWVRSDCIASCEYTA